MVAGAVGVVVLVGGAVVIGRMTASETATRELLITPRPVERRDLDDVLTINGEVRREETQTINLPVDGKVSSIEVEDGDTVAEGDPLFALDGRTAVAVAGDFAFYRTLDVGSDGPDVLQLETVLQAAGYDVGTPDQLFTERTRSALTAWQVDRGYGGATPEPSETITVGLAPNSAGYTIGKANTVAFTIDPSAPVVGGAGASPVIDVRPAGTPQKPVITLTSDLSEVDEGGRVTLTFTATPAPAADLVIDLTIGGDATAGTDSDDSDYREFDNSFVMEAGSSTHTIRIPVWVDQVREDDEEIVVSLTDQFGNDPTYVVGQTNQARITINANGQDLIPVLTVTSTSEEVAEGGVATFTFTSTVELNTALDLRIALSGSAVNGEDYVEVETDDVTLPAGATEVNLQVQLRGDGDVEQDETLTVAVVGVSGADGYRAGSPSSATVTVQSGDIPEFTISGGGSIAEGSVGSFTITADAPVTDDTSVNYQVGGTAISGDDFEVLTGTAIMRAGQSQVTVSITTIDDDVVFLPSDMVVADWPARVGTVEVDEGEFVLQGAPVLTLTEPVFTITLSVTATDRAELAVGQKALVSLDAADLELDGIIATLDDNATVDDTGAEVYEGTVEVSGDLEAVDGARAVIDVTLDERIGVLAVPVAAVLRSGGGDEVRVVNDDGRISRVPVVIGLVDGEWVEIIEGLVGNELIIVDVDPEAVVADGA
jgi:multidrug efflux pump subunit AcrA (membrane-fusion protein)